MEEKRSVWSRFSSYQWLCCPQFGANVPVSGQKWSRLQDIYQHQHDKQGQARIECRVVEHREEDAALRVVEDPRPEQRDHHDIENIRRVIEQAERSELDRKVRG